MTDRVARLVLAIVGLALLAVGAYGVVRGADAFDDAQTRLVTDATQRWFARNDVWFWPVVAAASALIACAALLALRRQLAVGGGSVVVDASERGQTAVRTDAVSAALVRDLEAHPAVERARARIALDADHDELAIRLVVRDDVPADVLVREIVEPAVERVRDAFDDDAIVADVVVAAANGSGPRPRRVA